MKATSILFFAAMLATQAMAQDDTGADVQKWTNRAAPAFIMTTTTGKKLTNANLKGKVVLLDFWATWCIPCKAASPIVDGLQKRYAKDGFVAIGANVQEPNNPKLATSNYKKRHNLSYTFTYNNEGLATSLGVGPIPTFVVIDRQGIVRYSAVGTPRDIKQLDRILDSVIRQLVAKR